MRIIACALGALALVAGSAAAASAQTQPKPSKRHVEKDPGANAYAASPRGNGYTQHLADKLPIGSSAWWDQMRREGRLGGETP